MEVDNLFANAEFVEQLQRILRAHGNNHFPALRNQIDDLVSATLADVWRYLKRTPQLVGAVSPTTGLSEHDLDVVTRVAVTILKRRAADLYRVAAGKWAEQALSHAGGSERGAVADTTSIPRRVLLRRMLQVCVAELARCSPEDREVLGTLIGIAAHDRRGFSDVERQRLSRLRKRLAEAIHRELGEPATALLAAELREE